MISLSPIDLGLVVSAAFAAGIAYALRRVASAPIQRAKGH